MYWIDRIVIQSIPSKNDKPLTELQPKFQTYFLPIGLSLDKPQHFPQLPCVVFNALVIDNFGSTGVGALQLILDLVDLWHLETTSIEPV